MFDNSITLTSDVAVIGGPLGVSITDTDNGRTTRSLLISPGNRIDLTLSRTDSTENRGVISDRYLVRVDRLLTETTTPYAPVKISAYTVLVVPRRPDVTTDLVGDTYMRMLGVLVDTTPLSYGDVSTLLGRLLSGET
jgi:hypothetical protein